MGAKRTKVTIEFKYKRRGETGVTHTYSKVHEIVLDDFISETYEIADAFFKENPGCKRVGDFEVRWTD